MTTDTFIRHIQTLHNLLNPTAPPLHTDGVFGPKTSAAVKAWYDTITKQHAAPSMADYLGVEHAALQAVIEIESPQGAFERSTGDCPQGRPPILFEAHHFHKHTKGRYTFTHPHLSSRYWDRSLYTNDEYQRLSEAQKLDEDAAYKSASWGKYQILGSNYAACGHPTVQSFVQAMRESEQAQDEAFVNFIEAHPGMHQALRSRDWPTFARLYNGPGYKTHRYDEKLAQAYERHAAERTV